MSDLPPNQSNYPRPDYAWGSFQDIPTRPPGAYFDLASYAFNLFKKEWSFYVFGFILIWLISYPLMIAGQFLAGFITTGSILGLIQPDKNAMEFTLLAALINILPSAIMQTLVGGYYSAILKQIRGQAPEFGDIFSVFKKFSKFLAIAIILHTALLPVNIASGLSANTMRHSGTAGLTTMLVLLLVGCILLFAICVPLALMPFIAAMEDYGPVETIVEAFRRCKSVYFGLLGSIFIAGAVGAIGVFACCIGLCVSVPVCYIMVAIQYFYLSPFNISASFAPGTEIGNVPPTY